MQPYASLQFAVLPSMAHLSCTSNAFVRSNLLSTVYSQVLSPE